jgi:hypothetical protein
MQKLALLMIAGVTMAPYLATGDKWGRMAILPGPAKYLPEILGAAALLLVIVLGVRDRFRFVRPAYWVVFGLLAVCLISSGMANALEPGPLLSGIRAYLRSIPWFLVPAVFAFTEKNLQTQLKWLLAISLLQLPISIEQRHQTATNNYYGFTALTGDWTTGTLMGSGDLSIFLISGACVIAALTLKRQLPKLQGCMLAMVLLVPTMINETKVTVFFLPLGVALTFLAAARRGERLKQLVVALLAFCVFLAAFVPVYDWVQQDRAGDSKNSLEEFFSGDHVGSYLESGTGIGSTKPVGRVDAARIGIEETLSDPVRTVFGLGIGNTMVSSLGPQFSGKYFERYGQVTEGTNFATMVLELGFLGFGLVMLLHWLILRDAWFVAAHGDAFNGALAAAWVGINTLIVLSLPYSTVQLSVALSFLFWYFSGYIAAERARLTTVADAPHSARASATVADAPAGRMVHAPDRSPRKAARIPLRARGPAR